MSLVKNLNILLDVADSSSNTLHWATEETLIFEKDFDGLWCSLCRISIWFVLHLIDINFPPRGRLCVRSKVCRLIKTLIVTISTPLQTGICSKMLLHRAAWPVTERILFYIFISDVLLGLSACIGLGIHAAFLSAWLSVGYTLFHSDIRLPKPTCETTNVMSSDCI